MRALALQAPVQRRAVHVQDSGHVLAMLAVTDQLQGMVDLLPGALGRAPSRHMAG